jgi:hypothetical protein
MTFAWYAHLKELSTKPWLVAALASWGIAFFEYMLQVPANRIGYGVLSLGQLKILQEVIALSVFVPFGVEPMEIAPFPLRPFPCLFPFSPAFPFGFPSPDDPELPDWCSIIS